MSAVASADTATTGKWTYFFGDGKADGAAGMKNLLGGKGANLAEMSSLGLPVPPGFTIPTDACTYYYQNNKSLPPELDGQIAAALGQIEALVGTKFGDAENPLLVSVRSGSRVSMPGMMDTVLNLGLNDVSVEGLAKRSGDPRFAYDSYRRFITMYSDVVLGIDHYEFEDLLDTLKRDRDYSLDTQLTAEDWQELLPEYKAVVKRALGRDFPQDVQEQLMGAVKAVFQSWDTPRAKTYRRLHDIPEEWGTAVNVQAMVFGNMGEDCATGVAFTRDPSTGDNEFYGEYLVNAQGEDVVAGIRTPQHLTIRGKEKQDSTMPAMEEVMPEVFGQLNDVRLRLEKHYRDMQDIEFTVQSGKLFMLQTRSGKRTAPAALKIAIEMAKEGLITEEEAVMRVDPASLDQLLHPTLDPTAEKTILSKGLPASPGAASGMIAFSSDETERLVKEGHNAILVRIETSPEDIHGMHAARGILTTRGGMTSHAAVVARGMGRACVAGAGDIRIDYKAKTLHVRDITLKEGDVITIDGGTGEVMLGEIPTKQPELSGDFAMLMGWADKSRRMRIRTNAETPADARTAVKFGAEGIGLCRTEHMFFEADRILTVREMILAADEAGRRDALSRIEPMQRQDFVELFQIMRGLPVTIRLLDPPLHEFLPHQAHEIEDVATALKTDVEEVRHRVLQLSESNPMLGHRGCRLGVSYPEIYEMQARAIIEGAISVQQESGETVVPEIMIPLVGMPKELAILKALVDKVAAEAVEKSGVSLGYMVGTMIELPRAALCADQIAESAEFFSFGTNDLTQTTFGISRDDAGSFLPLYQDKGIVEKDPFVSLDPQGVGQLVAIGCEKGKATRPDIKLGICGEHGGDPASIRFCEETGLDYVSCSPYRVPIARLAAAQASLAQKG
ncbi:MAG: pyruvate, phosphate dikinase [Alphaproteobacteria bacterium]|nr:pyruvate, phosphate dikinase [Alphaproteobacteria bacterium SS10]